MPQEEKESDLWGYPLQLTQAAPEISEWLHGDHGFFPNRKRYKNVQDAIFSQEGGVFLIGRL
jgi:hypothetical protein